MGEGREANFGRFLLSGTIGTVLFYGFYEMVYAFVPYEKNRAAIAWTISYLCSIVWQHALHRYLVFGGRGSYWKTLFWTYVSYSLSIVLSHFLMAVLVDFLGIDYRLSWGGTLGVTGLLNYLMLKIAFGKEQQKQD